jgi:uncharacterized protein YjeT (DUF2065 family)
MTPGFAISFGLAVFGLILVVYPRAVQRFSLHQPKEGEKPNPTVEAEVSDPDYPKLLRVIGGGQLVIGAIGVWAFWP